MALLFRYVGDITTEVTTGNWLTDGLGSDLKRQGKGFGGTEGIGHYDDESYFSRGLEELLCRVESGDTSVLERPIYMHPRLRRTKTSQGLCLSLIVPERRGGDEKRGKGRERGEEDVGRGLQRDCGTRNVPMFLS